MNLKHTIASVTAASALLFGGQASAIPVALELSLLIDVSGSVDPTEYALQRDGYVQAFQNASIQAAIAARPGGIAVNFIQWSGAAQQVQSVGWTQITNAAQANAFAALVAGLTQPFQGLTAPGSAINFATPLFNNNFEGDRQVIDVSGDGAENDGATTVLARNAALLGDIDAINGLAIGDINLLNWYNANIVGGANSFALQAATFGDFASAVTTKIGREITGVPEPTSLALAGLALLGVGVVRRRTAKA